LAFLLLLGLLPYAIVALVMTKRAKIELPLCSRHRSAWTWIAVVGLLLLLLTVGAFIALVVVDANHSGGRGPMDAATDSGACFLFPVVGLIALVMLVLGLRRVTPQRIDEQGNAWIKGVCDDYLDQHVGPDAGA
jgi:hypothetical protein